MMVAAVEQKPRVLVVLVNYNDWQNTRECLKSLKNLDYVLFDVALVDNSDKEDALVGFKRWVLHDDDDLTTAFPELVNENSSNQFQYVFGDQLDEGRMDEGSCIFYLRTQNKGFAAANNHAIRSCQDRSYQYYWLLNNDTIVRPEALSALLECASVSFSKVGIIGATIMQYYNPEKLQGIGGRYNKWLGKVSEVGANDSVSNLDHYSSSQFDYVIGASMFVSSAFVNEVGLMDDDLFLYYEELDWCLRGRKYGWTYTYCPKALVYHKQGASINREKNSRGNSELSDYYAVRNRLLIARRYFAYTLLTLYPSFIKFIITRLFYRQYDRINMFFRILANPRRHYFEYKADRYEYT